MINFFNIKFTFSSKISKTIVLPFLLVFLLLANRSESQVSLTFASGYLGTQQSAVQQTTNIQNFSTLGIARVSFSQSYSGAFGGTQGNDLAGVIKLYLTSGRVISLNGALNWRETSAGNVLDVYGLIFNAGQNASITYGSNQTYNIVGGNTSGSSTSLGLKAYASSVTFIDGSSRSGNAATNSIIGDMNAELTSTPQPSSIALTNPSVIEGQNLVYTVTLSTATTAGKPQVYTFSTSGAASKGTDYNATYTFSNGVIDNGDGTITVPGSVSSFTITISTIDDIVVENIENLLVSVGSKIGLGSIADNDNLNIANCDPNSLYDNIVSSYHQSIAKKSDGTFAVWGNLMGSNGTTNILSPQTINATNYPGLTGTILKTAVAGAASSANSQAILLTTDGLYAWGSAGNILATSLTSNLDAFAKINTPTGGDASTKLPTGVTPGSVKMMVAFYQTLVLVTNAGNVWVLTQTNGELRGVGTTTAATTTWNKVKIDASNDLTNVISVRGMVDDATFNGLMALTADGKAFVWGKTVYLADGNASVAKSYATQMTLPAEFNSSNLPKMIAVTGGNKTTSASCKNTFYILSNNGSLYAVGDNQKKQIGDFTTTERKTWVKVKISATTDFTNINFISAMESDPSDPAIVAITKEGVLYTWGFNPRNMIGRPTADIAYDPGVPSGFLQGTDKAIFAEMGGHTLVYIKEGSSQFCYVGHRINGSMGDGTTTDTDEVAFNCSGTPSLAVCGSVPVAASSTTSTISANPTSISADGITTSTITVQLKQANGTNLTTTGGTVIINTTKGSISNVTDNNDGTYTAILTSSSFVETASLSYTLNGSAGTNTASVNFTAVTTPPTLTATGTLKTFTSCSGCTVSPQSFTVSGTDMSTNNLVVTAPNGVQVSTTINSGYASSINITPTAGTVTTTTVYAKLTNNGTSVNSGVITVTATGAAAKTITVTTNTDNALNFDGTNDYISLPSMIPYTNNSITIDAWIRTTALSTDARRDIISWGNTAVGINVVEFRVSYGKLQFILNDGTKFYSLTSVDNVNTGKWTHVALVKSGSSINLYIDGQAANTTTAGDPTAAPVPNTNSIGVLGYNGGAGFGLSADSYFSGDMDQLRVWNTAKTGTEITDNRFVEMTGNETDLVANYGFNQGIAAGTNSGITTITDNSISPKNGTLSGFTLTGTTTNFVVGFIPAITAAGSATSVAVGNTLQLSNGLSGGIWSSSNTSFATVNASTGLVTGVASGSLTITYTICDKVVSYSLNVFQPTITTSGTLKTFTTCSGCAITPQSFTVSGINLGAAITLTAPTGVVMSTATNGTYSNTLTLSQTNGVVGSTPIYVKLSNNASSNAGGVINITSSGASSKTMTITTSTDNALMLDGVDDYVNLGTSLGVPNLAYTTEAWVYWKGSNVVGVSEIFSKEAIQSLSISNTNKLHVNFGDGGSWDLGLNSTTLIPLNKWTHVAVTRSSGGLVKIYINGILDASTANLSKIGSNTQIRGIGVKNVSGTLLGAFPGAIDNIKVWNVEKSASDIASGMYTELAGNETDLLAYYNFNQGIANGSNTGISTLLDGSSSGLNGTLTNITKTGTTSNFVDGFMPAIQTAANASGNNNSLSFDGADDYVVGNVNGTNVTAFTIEAFVNPANTTQGTKGVLSWADQTSTGTPMVLLQQDGANLKLYVNGGYNITTPISANTWSHVAIVYANSLYTLYVNGTLVGTYSGGISVQQNAQKIFLGNGYPGYWNGLLDEVRVWNVARSASEINNNMYNDLSGTESGLMAYYNMNQAVANGTNTGVTTLNDKTANANNGTITNFALTGTSSNFVTGNTQVGTSAAILAGSTYALANNLTGGVWTSSNTSKATVDPSTGVVTGVSTGALSITYTICGKTVSYPVTVITPTITVANNTLKTFASCSGCNVTPQYFTVSGANLSGNVIVTAPTGFELSATSGGTYSATLTLPSATVATGNVSVFVRLINNATTATGGSITVASTGAISQTVSVTVNTDNALNFDGVNDYVVIPDANALDLTSSFTIETWVYPTSNSGSQVIIGKINESSGNSSALSYALRYNAGVLKLEVYGSSSFNISTNNLQLNKWQHVAGVFDNGNMTLYIDGVQQAAGTTVGFNSVQVNTATLKLGAYAGTYGQYFSGAMDQVRIWNIAKSQSDISNEMYTNLNGKETGLVAYYNFDQRIANGTNTGNVTLYNQTSTASINGTLTNYALTGNSSNYVVGFIPSNTGTATINVGASSTLSNTLTGGTWSSSNTSVATVNSTTGVVTGVAAGSSTITYTICDKTVSTLFTVTVPTITTAGTLTAFSTCATTNSTAQTFTVSAQYLTSNLDITAPAGYEIATSSGGTYSSTISIAPTAGAVSARLIYVRTTNAILNGQSGNINITSTGATTKTVATGNAVVTQNRTASVTISSNATNNTICSGANITFTATPTNGGTTPTYQWKLNGNNISGATNATYTTASLTNNSVISVVMGSSLSSCISGSPASSNTITVTVNTIPATPGAITGATNICMNSNQVYSIATVPGATSYSWVVTGDLNATSSTNNVINITASNTAGSGTIKVLANNVCGSSAYSNILNITINNTPAPTAAFTTSASNVCLANAGVTFTSTSTPNATTNAAITTYAWAFGDGTTASTATASNTYTASGNYDAILTITDNAACTSSISSRITVDPLSVAGTASAATATICEGTSTTLSLTGYTGTIQWQSSIDGNNWNNITGATASTYNTGTLTSTTYYQAVVTSGACSAATSGVVTVTVSPTPSATLASVTNIFTTSTSFDLGYSNTIGNPNEYSITTVSPNTMPNFAAINNYGLISSPITVNVPASVSGTYNFNLVLRNNTLGCTSAALPFTVTVAVQAPANLSYTTPNVYTVGSSITNLNPTSTGGVITQYTIGPSLPPGLTINPTTGVISGTPSAVSSQTSYTVTGTNASGTVTATVVITVVVAPPASLSYTTPNVYTVGSTITNLNPTSTGGPITQYTIGTPSLPAGLTINPTTGVISGTPSAVSSQTSYTVTGTNASGTVTATVVITVNAIPNLMPQGGIDAIDYRLFATDTVKLKVNITAGVSPYTIILSNNFRTAKDTLTNVLNGDTLNLKSVSANTIYTLYKITDNAAAVRSSGFTKDTTGVTIVAPNIALTLKADKAVKQSDNSFKTKLLLKIKNLGQINLRNVQVNANLSEVFPAGIMYTLDSVRVVNGNIRLSNNYQGNGTATSPSSVKRGVTASAGIQSNAVLDANYLLDIGNNLAINEEADVNFYLSIAPTTQSVVLKLQFSSAGDGILPKAGGYNSQQSSTAVSDNGTNLATHPNNTSIGTPLPTYLPLFPVESIAAALKASNPTPVVGGYTFDFVAKAKNFSNMNLDTVAIFNDLSKIFVSPDTAYIIGTPVVTGGARFNTNYNGYTDTLLIDSTAKLAVGDSITVSYTLFVGTNKTSGSWSNAIFASGHATLDYNYVWDISTDGTNPDPNGDGDPKEQGKTYFYINYTPPGPPTVENKTYTYGNAIPPTIGGLVKSYPIGTIPVWCDVQTALCSPNPPATPTIIGKYVYQLKSYDTTTKLYSIAHVNDTVIIRPPVPLVNDSTYIIGQSNNPANVSVQVKAMTGGTLKYYLKTVLLNSVPVLGTSPSVIIYTVSQVVNQIESDTVSFKVTLLSPNELMHLQKIAGEAQLQANSSYNIPFTFIARNVLNKQLDSVLITDNLSASVLMPSTFTVVSLSSTGGLVANASFNGKTDINLTQYASKLIASAVDTIHLVINVMPNGYTGALQNTAIMNAKTPYGKLTMNSSSKAWAAGETTKYPTNYTIPDLKIDIPEGFSPNRDGVNDKFVIIKPFGTTLDVEVYNRWGNVVYTNPSYNNEWDGKGTNNFIGQDLMDGGYYYTIKAKFANGNVQIFKGFVLIQR